MKTRKSLSSIGAITVFGLALTVLWPAEIGAATAGETAEEKTIVPAASRPTPPATRPIDPSGAADRARGPSAVRHPREVPMARIDPSHFIQNATKLLDQEVVTESGRHLGPVEDLIIDITTGNVAFVAVGPGPRLRPVPPQAFLPKPGEGLLALDADIDRWEEAPAIERHEIVQLARDRNARRIYRYYDLDYEATVAELERQASREQVYGAPSRWRQRHATEPGYLPGDPALPRSVPPALPPDRTRVHPELRWDREFGTPGERGAVQERRSAERERADREFEGRREAREEAGPSLRNPRLHYSHRGTNRLPWAADTVPREYGRARAERDAGPPPAERLQWAGELIGQPTADRGGEPTGKVSDLIIDLDRGQVQHVIVTYDRPERQMYAIPLQDVEIDEHLRVSVKPTAEALRDVPRFSPRDARLRPNQAFRYEAEAATREFGVPERNQEEGPSRL